MTTALPRAALLSLAATISLACGGTTDVTTTTTSDAALAPYLITPALCTDNSGPDCTKLRLGNSSLTITAPAVGKLFSCVAGNASAPGSNAAKITWIDYTANTWNLLRKPFLPAKAGAAAGTITVTDQNGTRTIQSNNLPVDAKIGNWPMTAYDVLTAIDPNPGIPAARSVSYALQSPAVAAATPTCVGMGAIGVTLNGVVLYNAIDARGNDAVANEIVDVYGGHPAMTDYHYHSVPERLDGSPTSDGHSGIIGYIRDGFPIYGYHGVGRAEVTNADLDECHGHSHGTYGYHYHATMEYPYTIGCYRGTPR
jgi:hypothetical protein